MRVTRQEIQIFGAAAILLAAVLFAFSGYPVVERVNDAIRLAVKISPAAALAGIGLVMLLVPIAVPGLQRILRAKELPQLVVAPEDSPQHWKRAQVELRGLFYSLVVLLGTLLVLTLMLMPGSRLIERSRAHTRIVGAIRNAARVAAFSFPASNPTRGWRPFALMADAQMERDSLRDVPALSVLCRLLRSSPRALMQEVEHLSPPADADPRLFAAAAWNLGTNLRGEDATDLAHVYLLLGRFMASQSEDGRFVSHVEKARAFLAMAGRLGIEDGVVSNGLAACDIATFIRPVAAPSAARPGQVWPGVDARVEWTSGWQALRRLEAAEALARDPVLRERIQNNLLYLDMRMCQAIRLYDQAPPDSGIFQFEAERVHRLRDPDYLDSLIDQSATLAARTTPEAAVYATTWCQGLLLRAALEAKAAGLGRSTRRSRVCFAEAVQALEDNRLVSLRGELGRHLDTAGEAERYFFGAFARCDPTGVVRRRLALAFREE